MCKLKIEDLNLHDSRIKSVTLHRKGAEDDIVDIFLEYVEDYETSVTSGKILRFMGCYKFIGDINFGFGSSDSIINASSIIDSKLISEEKNKWSKIDKNILSKPLKHYRIETDTTGSTIDIVASSIELIDS